MTAPQALPPLATHGPLRYTPNDVCSIPPLPLCPFSNSCQAMGPPPASTFTQSQLPSPDQSTARDHIIDTIDRPYTRTPSCDLVFPYPHVPPSIHKTQLGSDHSVDRRSIPHTPSRFIPREITPDHDSRSRHNVEHGIGPSVPHGEERTSFPVPSSSRMVSDTTRSAPQLTLEGRSIRTRSRKKQHKCDVCGSYWERPSFLRIHMVSHTRVKGTLKSSSYSNRANVHRPEFVCPICRRGFGVKSSYTRHIRALHKDWSE